MALCALELLTEDEMRRFIKQPMALPRFTNLLPEVGEVYPFGNLLLFPKEPYDDGGGAVVCRARFGI